MKKELFEQKIFICSLGIVLITLLFYVFQKKFLTLIEPIPLDFDIPGWLLGGTNIGSTLSGIAQGAVGIATSVGNMIKTAAMFIAQKATTMAVASYQTMKSLGTFAKQQATAAKSTAIGVAKQSAIQAQNKAGQVALAVRGEAKALGREAKSIVRITKTFKFITRMIKKVWPVLKWGFKLVLLLNLMGKWGIKTIDVLLYRLSHFKDCFLWYTLEIIGQIIYIPCEFFVWLFCLKTAENSFWDLVETIDCKFFESTGFHIFHYSDAIMQRCYAKKFPPFPYNPVQFDGDGSFTEEKFAEFVVEWFLPPSPNDIKDAVDLIAKGMKSPEAGEVLKHTTDILKDDMEQLFKIPKFDPDDVKNQLGDIFNIDTAEVKDQAKKLFGSGIKI